MTKVKIAKGSALNANRLIVPPFRAAYCDMSRLNRAHYVPGPPSYRVSTSLSVTSSSPPHDLLKLIREEGEGNAEAARDLRAFLDTWFLVDSGEHAAAARAVVRDSALFGL